MRLKKSYYVTNGFISTLTLLFFLLGCSKESDNVIRSDAGVKSQAVKTEFGNSQNNNAPPVVLTIITVAFDEPPHLLVIYTEISTSQTGLFSVPFSIPHSNSPQQIIAELKNSVIASYPNLGATNHNDIMIFGGPQ